MIKYLKFYDILKKNRINVTIRKELGGKVSAACGQLRAKAMKEGVKVKLVITTDPGKVRSHNEDSVIILKNGNGEYLLVVADGMGGHKVVK